MKELDKKNLTVKYAIRVITMKVILDIVAGYSMDIEAQVQMLRDLANDLEASVKQHSKGS